MNIQFQNETHMQWAVEYQQFLESGMTQPEWCRLHNLKVGTFQYRLTKLRKLYGAESAEYVHSGFARLVPPAPDVNTVDIPAGQDYGSCAASSVILEAGKNRIIIPSDVEESRVHMILEVFLNAQ